ncbi:hypothetical protein [Nocardioides sp. T2.26MG-1]|uniref:hypothetical protein n=1 Tax=Nocardioides sp. T2.26MG-1 TaxID=3041166 RepID=UPI0025409E08|nr:hypothetical protein [Nocardioides sp. T2.26MG-1]
MRSWPGSRANKPVGLGRVAAAITAAVALACSTAACDDSQGADPQASDALYPVGDKHQLCAPSKRWTTFTEGFDAFGNRGPAPVTIEKVDWPTTGDVKADSIQVFQRQPQDRFSALGLVEGLPEKLTGSPGRAWQRSQPADGAALELADPDTGGYLLFAIGVRGTEGTGGPLTIHYTDGDGHAGTATSLITLSITNDCQAAHSDSDG